MRQFEAVSLHSDLKKSETLLRYVAQDNPFLTVDWLLVLAETYGYKPIILSLYEESEILAVIPIMEIQSILTGRRGVSLPFSDFSGLYARDRETLQEMFERVIDYGRERSWKRVELRCGDRFLPGTTCAVNYIEHTINLDRSIDDVKAALKASVRRNIRKGQKSGLTITINAGKKQLNEFIRLNRITRKRHGLPPQPSRFFKRLYDEVVAKGDGRLITASIGENTIAAALFLRSGDKVVFKYGASDIRYQGLRANNLVMWKAIELYHGKGVKSFSFGRSSRHNRGLLQFKDGWGTDRSDFPYYSYDLSTGVFLSGGSIDTGRAEQILKHVPIPLLQFIGYTLYRHVA
jgi:CelD/BcsL family acetyltransferase involved in cellulose biosynthesis